MQALASIKATNHSAHSIQAIINKSYFFQDSDVSNSMLISSKHGQRYQCTLPQLETEETIKDARTEFTTEEVTDLLKPMQNRCLYHVSILIKIGSIGSTASGIARGASGVIIPPPLYFGI